MTKRELNYFDILEAKKKYAEGQNITEHLRAQKNVASNTSEIIETAYDLQAGTYIEHVKNNPAKAASYTNELAQILSKHVKQTDLLVDIGTGELTTLSPLINGLIQKPKAIYAFDISRSRIFKGLEYAKEKLAHHYKLLTPFVANISEIPLLDKSINITTSSHALEPNGEKLKELMTELFRVTIDKLVLFEPCFEINSEEGKQRMARLGYIQNLDGVVESLGGKVIEKIMIKSISNPLNPTVCFVIKPPIVVSQTSIKRHGEANIFSVPGTNIPLRIIDNFYFSDQTGLCYPILRNIPVFKSSSAILASALSE